MKSNTLASTDEYRSATCAEMDYFTTIQTTRVFTSSRGR